MAQYVNSNIRKNSLIPLTGLNKSEFPWPKTGVSKWQPVGQMQPVNHLKFGFQNAQYVCCPKKQYIWPSVACEQK